MDLGWKVTKEAVPELEQALRTNLAMLDQQGDDVFAELAVETYLDMVKRTCDDVLPKRKMGGARRTVYWWNDEIRGKKEECTATRRQLKRMKKRGDQQ